ATIAKELAGTATDHITDTEIDNLEHINEALASAVASGDAEVIAATEFAFHRAFNHATGRIKLAWFLLHVARYMPLLIYAADPGWGSAAVDNHRQLIAALRHRDAAAVVEHTNWQFIDGARRLADKLDSSGIWD
ncbi:MAG: GntR family transcriptional regulator, partial [Mycobacterium sp.]|nr:GntR family transcriptional regulator [Mycobacterium sp.]